MSNYVLEVNKIDMMLVFGEKVKRKRRFMPFFTKSKREISKIAEDIVKKEKVKLQSATAIIYKAI